ncbi:MAG: hypothetical protein AB7L41_04560 [Flavobacteriaceae bacterium]
MSDPIPGQPCPEKRATLPRKGLPALAGRLGARIAGALVDGPALAAFLRRRHPFDTAWKVADVTGIPMETVRNWLRLRAAPSASNFWTLAEHYGPDLVAASVRHAPGWLDTACRAEEHRRLSAELQDLQARLRELEEQS